MLIREGSVWMKRICFEEGFVFSGKRSPFWKEMSGLLHPQGGDLDAKCRKMSRFRRQCGKQNCTAYFEQRSKRWDTMWNESVSATSFRTRGAEKIQVKLPSLGTHRATKKITNKSDDFWNDHFLALFETTHVTDPVRKHHSKELLSKFLGQRKSRQSSALSCLFWFAQLVTSQFPRTAITRMRATPRTVTSEDKSQNLIASLWLCIHGWVYKMKQEWTGETGNWTWA